MGAGAEREHQKVARHGDGHASFFQRQIQERRQHAVFAQEVVARLTDEVPPVHSGVVSAMLRVWYRLAASAVAPRSTAAYSDGMPRPPASGEPTLDLHGMRVREALQLTEQDSADRAGARDGRRAHRDWPRDRHPEGGHRRSARPSSKRGARCERVARRRGARRRASPAGPHRPACLDRVPQPPTPAPLDTANGRGSSGTTCNGRLTENVLPPPGLLVAQIRPPCCSAIPRLRYRPSPRPAKRRSSTFDPR